MGDRVEEIVASYERPLRDVLESFPVYARNLGSGEPGPLTVRIGRLYQQYARAHGVRVLAPSGDG